MCAVTILPTGDSSIGTEQVHNTSVNHQTSQPGREHRLIQSNHSFPSAIFLWAHWASLPASLQLVSPPHTRWLRLPKKHLPFQSQRDRFSAKRSCPYHQYGGGMVAQRLASWFHCSEVKVLMSVHSSMFTPCLSRFPPTISRPVIQMDKGRDYPQK